MFFRLDVLKLRQQLEEDNEAENEQSPFNQLELEYVALQVLQIC